MNADRKSSPPYAVARPRGRPAQPLGARGRGRCGRGRGGVVPRDAGRRGVRRLLRRGQHGHAGASIFHLAKGLHRRKFFTTREIAAAAWKQAYFRIVGVEDPEHVAEARASALAFIKGHEVSELESLGEEIFDEAMATASGRAPARWPSCTSTRASGSGW